MYECCYEKFDDNKCNKCGVIFSNVNVLIIYEVNSVIYGVCQNVDFDQDYGYDDYMLESFVSIYFIMISFGVDFIFEVDIGLLSKGYERLNSLLLGFYDSGYYIFIFNGMSDNVYFILFFYVIENGIVVK